jgi:hypothetical protein
MHPLRNREIAIKSFANLAHLWNGQISRGKRAGALILLKILDEFAKANREFVCAKPKAKALRPRAGADVRDITHTCLKVIAQKGFSLGSVDAHVFYPALWCK